MKRCRYTLWGKKHKIDCSLNINCFYNVRMGNDLNQGHNVLSLNVIFQLQFCLELMHLRHSLFHHTLLMGPHSFHLLL